MKIFSLPLFVATLAACSLSAAADIVINEFSATSSQRVLRTDATGDSHVGWGPTWKHREFDDGAWKDATMPIGHGHPEVETDVRNEMRNVAHTLYLRRKFTVSAEDAARDVGFRFLGKFEDGFIVHVNGREICRGNMGGARGYGYHDQPAFNDYETSSNSDRIDSDVRGNQVLVEGENVLAIQVHTDELDSNVLMDPDLRLGRGLFSGEVDVRLLDNDEGWKYIVGVVEPSGGLFDMGLANDPDYEVDFEDWIELHNNGDEAVTLLGWSLTDTEENLELWKFPIGASIEPGGYLVVMADGYAAAGSGRDYLHANFKLSGGGEYVALVRPDGNIEDEVPDYPAQDAFHSYQRTGADGVWMFGSRPSPGAANGGPVFSARVDRPDFSQPGGFYSGTMSLEITSQTKGAEIYYTMDGSVPTPENGTLYTAAITLEPIDEKTGPVVRAKAYLDGLIPSKVESATYLIDQDEALETLPAVTLIGDAENTFYKPNGVLSIEGGRYSEGTWSVEDPIEDYNMALKRGRAYERTGSFELLNSNDPDANFQIDTGVRLAASNWSRPRMLLTQTDRSPWPPGEGHQKPSLNVYFRGDYGDDELNRALFKDTDVNVYDQFRVRAGKNDVRNPFIRDELMRRIYSDTGQVSAVGLLNTLYVNGSYKGYYNLTARLRGPFFAEAYGTTDDYDIIMHDGVASGDEVAWDDMMGRISRDLSDLENYKKALEVIDVVNVADYLIVNSYAATWDWPHNNFGLARERSEDGKWRMQMWDAEGGMGHIRPVSFNSFTTSDRGLNTDGAAIPRIYRALKESPEFRLVFADRINKHFFNGGALTQERLTARLDELREEIQPVMRFTINQSVNDNSLEDWIDDRERLMIKSDGQYEKEGLWGEIQAPTIRPHGGVVEAGLEVKLSAGSLFTPQPGVIYYTTDGSDPRELGGAIGGTALSYDDTGAFTLSSNTTISTRVLDEDAWGPMTTAVFYVGNVPATRENLVISEIMYDPALPSEAETAAGFTKSDFEFIEMYNAGDQTVDLTGVRFLEGIDFVFSDDMTHTLEPGGYVVIGRSMAALQMRYGASLVVVGEYGKKLNNDGENLVLRDASGEIIQGFTYSDRDPWPDQTDGEGYSLVLLNPVDLPDHADPTMWTESEQVGGSPGGVGTPVEETTYAEWRAKAFSAEEAGDDDISGPGADPDGDGMVNLLEYALLGLPKTSSAALPVVAVERLTVDNVEGDYLTVTYSPRTDAADLSLTIETSSGLSQWTAVPGLAALLVRNNGDSVTYRLPNLLAATGELYVRLHAELK